jgi:DNA integrity scanning protein DisA with diadenylate cyclase activity
MLRCINFSIPLFWVTLKSAKYFSKQMRELNKKVALFITEKVGTMSCAYLFALIAFISLPEALSSEDPLEIVSWIAETFLQLVLLSIIIVGQNIQSEIAEEQAQTDRETLIAIKKLAEEIHVVATQ